MGMKSISSPDRVNNLSGENETQLDSFENVSRIREFNQILLDENRDDVSISQYLNELNKRYFKIDISFIDLFMLLVERDDFCIDGKYLKSCEIQAANSDSSKTLRLLQRNGLIEGSDFLKMNEVVEKQRLIHLFDQ